MKRTHRPGDLTPPPGRPGTAAEALRRACRRRLQRRGVDAGSGTVLVLAVAFLVLAAGGAASVVGVATAVRHRAETAADLAALSGAAAVARGGDGCRTAARAATANGAVLRSCRVLDQMVDVSVSVQPGGPLASLPPARVAARAGPAAGSSR